MTSALRIYWRSTTRRRGYKDASYTALSLHGHHEVRAHLECKSNRLGVIVLRWQAVSYELNDPET